MEIIVACLIISAGLLFAAEIISDSITKIEIRLYKLDEMMFRKLDDLVVNLSDEDYYDDEEPEEEIKEEESVSHILGVASASNCEPHKIHFKEEESK